MRRKPISSRVSCWSSATSTAPPSALSTSDRSTWRTSFRKSIVQPRAGFMSHSTRSGSVPVALFENPDFHLTGWNYPCRIVLSSCWTSRYEATLPAKPAAKAGLIFHFFQRGNSNSPRTTVTGKSFEVLFNIRQKSWRVGVALRPHLGRRGRTDYRRLGAAVRVRRKGEC